VVVVVGAKLVSSGFRLHLDRRSLTDTGQRHT
jgi:hypothetical protein